MSPSDTVLVEQWIRERDPEAMRIIVARYAGLVYAASLRILRRPEDAQDVTQECFLKLNTLQRPLRSLPAFLHTLATRQALNRLRAERRREAREHKYALQQAVGAPSLPDDVHQFVDEAIASLPVAYQTVLIRHYLQGEDHATIARDLGITRSGVTRRCRRGIERVRVQLKKQGVLATSGMIGTALFAQQASAVPPELQATLGRMAISGAKSAPVASSVPTLLQSLVTVPRVAVIVMLIAGSAFLGYMWREATTEPAGTPPAVFEAMPAQDVMLAADQPTPSDHSAVSDQATTPADAPPQRVRVRSESGFPRPTTYLSADWPVNIYAGVETDADSTIELTPELAAAESVMALCQYTQRAALISGAALRNTGEVVLDRRLISVTTRVVDQEGHGVRRTPLELRVTCPNGERFVSNRFYADAEGYADASLPGLAGDLVEVRRAACDDLAAGEWRSAATVSELDAHLGLETLRLEASVAAHVAGHPVSSDAGGCYASQLEDAGPRRRVGGIVVDDRGRPIGGVQLELLYSQGAMSSSQVASTDRTGTWWCMLPEDTPGLSIRPGHREHMIWPLVGEKAEDLAALYAGTYTLTLPRGVPFQGRVIDETGQPVGDALVLTHERYSTTPSGIDGVTSAPIEDATSTRTDAEGHFELACLPEGQHTLKIMAGRRALALHEVAVRPGMPPVVVRLAAGTTLRGRVVDETGNPVPFARLKGENWVFRGRQPLNAFGEADADGVFAIENLPIGGEIHLRVGLPKEENREDRPLASAKVRFPEQRDRPFIVTLYPLPRWSGTVRDSETGEPITDFIIRSGLGRDDSIYWTPFGTRPVHSEDGSFIHDLTGFGLSGDASPEGEPAPKPEPGYAMEITAKGYLPEVGEWLPLGGDCAGAVFEMTPHPAIVGVVVDVDGKPVEGAKVAWIEQSGPGASMAYDTFFTATDSEDYVATRSGPDGRFSLPPRRGPATLVAMHASGSLMELMEAPVTDVTLQLEPWAEVEACVYQDGQPAPDLPVLLCLPKALQRATGFHFYVAGDGLSEAGCQTLSHVPSMPLVAAVQRRTECRYALTNGVLIEPKSGERLRVEIGAEGTTVRGYISFDSALAPEPFEPGRLHLVAYKGGIPLEDDGLNAMGAYGAEVDADGQFAFYGIPEGRYQAWARYEMWSPREPEADAVLLAEGIADFVVTGEDAVELPPLVLRTP